MPMRIFLLSRNESNPRLMEAEADLLAGGRPQRLRDAVETPIVTPVLAALPGPHVGVWGGAYVDPWQGHGMEFCDDEEAEDD